MLIFANILFGIGKVLGILIDMMIFITIARAVISWVNPDPYNPIVRFLTSATDPLLRPLRRFIPPIGGGIDVTPIVLLLLLYFVHFALVQTILDYAMYMRGSRVIVPLPSGAGGSMT